jgi:hypothetical protein
VAARRPPAPLIAPISHLVATSARGRNLWTPGRLCTGTEPSLTVGSEAPKLCDMPLVRDPSGLYLRRDQPAGSRALDRRRDAGLLQSILPGVYADLGVDLTPALRVRALMLWRPDAILTRDIAAAMSFWPTRRVDVVSAVARCRGQSVGFAFERRAVPQALVWEAGWLRFTSPALTALDLCVADDGAAIDEVLRTRAASL